MKYHFYFLQFIWQGSSNDENICKRGASGLSCKLEIEDSKSNQNTGVLHEFHKKEVTKEGMEKQPLIEGKSGSCQDRDNAPHKMGAKKHSEKIVKDISLPSGRAGKKRRLIFRIIYFHELELDLLTFTHKIFRFTKQQHGCNIYPILNTTSMFAWCYSTIWVWTKFVFNLKTNSLRKCLKLPWINFTDNSLF